MRTVLVALVVVILVPFGFFAQAAAQKAAPAKSQTAEQEVSALERAWLDAEVKYDVAWFERYLANTIISTDENGAVTNKTAMVADVKTHANTYESLSYDDLKVQVYGDTAVATGIVVVKATSKGKDASGRFQWTDTWIRRGGQWQCVASHSSTIATK